MATGQIAGAGNNSAARNVIRVTFSQTLSAIPTLEAWDDSTFATVANQIFTGTNVSSTIRNAAVPLIYAAATTSVTPSSAWRPNTATAGGAMTNRLKGTTNFVNLSSVAPNATEWVMFNLGIEIPSDATVPSSSSLAHVIAIRYQYTGTAPTLTWEFNNQTGGGTEGTPVWAALTSGGAGNVFKQGDAGVLGSNVFITRPSTGMVDSGSCWVSTL